MKKTKIITAAEARQRFAEIADDARINGTVYSIVRHGKEVAQLGPPKSVHTLEVDSNLEKDIDEFFKEYKDVFEELAKR
jgi:antitoxin (DNA-binding transcriptional repressor) of toxin-antitoxin stability system